MSAHKGRTNEKIKADFAMQNRLCLCLCVQILLMGEIIEQLLHGGAPDTENQRFRRQSSSNNLVQER